MRNVYLLLVFFLLFSCSSNDDNNQYKLLKSIVEVADDGTSTTIYFTYNGNKIQRIDEPDKSMVFSYTGNLITEVITLDKKNQTQSKLQPVVHLGNIDF